MLYCSILCLHMGYITLSLIKLGSPLQILLQSNSVMYSKMGMCGCCSCNIHPSGTQCGQCMLSSVVQQTSKHVMSSTTASVDTFLCFAVIKMLFCLAT